MVAKYSDILEAGPKNWDRRLSCEDDLVLFWNTYLGKEFTSPLAAHHYKMAEELTYVMKNSAWSCQSEFRGAGKSTRGRGGILWGKLYGHCPYTVYVSQTGGSHKRTKSALVSTLRTNELLAEDFPEACYPVIHALGKQARAINQIWGSVDRPSGLEISKDAIVLANTGLEYSQCDESAMEFTSMGGDLLGRFRQLMNGETVRPKLVIIDDPASKKVAKSAQLSREQFETIQEDLGYLGDAGSRVGLMAMVTCKRVGDTADLMLSDPTFRPVRTKLVTKLPANLDWWDDYAVDRSEWQMLKLHPDEIRRLSNEKYLSERDTADEGHEVSWDHLELKDGHLSVIQYAMEMRAQNRQAYESELQNNSDVEEFAVLDGIRRLKPEVVQKRLIGIERGVAPANASVLVGHIDVSDSILWWTVMGFDRKFTGHVMTYGQWPEQGRMYVSANSVAKTLMDQYGGTRDSAWIEGLNELIDMLCDREWKTEAGDVLRMTALAIDANDPDATTIVNNVCRRSKYASILIPSYGRPTSAKQPYLWRPATKKKPGKVRGEQWRVRPLEDGVRSLEFNANHWKSRACTALMAGTGSPGAVTLWGSGTDWQLHGMVGDHYAAEKGIEASEGAVTLEVWREQGQEEHHWDNVVACMALASRAGCSLVESQKQPSKPKLSWSQMRARHRG